MELKFGLGTLENLFSLGLSELAGNEVRCIVYNANLDYVLEIFKRFDQVKAFEITANSENFTHSPENTEEIMSLTGKGRLRLRYISENRKIVHAKVYGIYKEGECLLFALGSPNLTKGSNRSLESLLLLRNPVPDKFSEVWDLLKSKSFDFIQPTSDPPPFLYRPTLDTIFSLDPSITEGLWRHQVIILEWLSSRPRAIVNIPPGTGKTTVALRYLQHLTSSNDHLAAIVLVPTKTLLEQWMSLLPRSGFEVLEGGTHEDSYTDFLAGPEGKVLVTLYQRFSDNRQQIADGLTLLGADCLVVADECHSLYGQLEGLYGFANDIITNGSEYFHIGLSATIDSFRVGEMESYVSHCGGDSGRFQIELAPFYARWNDLNDRPILKEIEYEPHMCNLTESEMERYEKLTRRVAMEMGSRNLSGDSASAAFLRAYHVRNSENGKRELHRVLSDSITSINQKPSLIFVQTHKIAESLRSYITAHKDWDPLASAYVYDSARSARYRDYAMAKFRENRGFCLISERMLAEGFDLPSISLVILHGSHKSERDWIQKVGRALRYDPANPSEIAKVIDIVFCDTNGSILPIEEERFATLSSISVGGQVI